MVYFIAPLVMVLLFSAALYGTKNVFVYCGDDVFVRELRAAVENLSGRANEVVAYREKSRNIARQSDIAMAEMKKLKAEMGMKSNRLFEYNAAMVREPIIAREFMKAILEHNMADCIGTDSIVRVS